MPAEELEASRPVRQRDWLEVRLQVLGLRLSYPAYRVDLALSDSNRVHFEFWLSAPMAQHLQQAGRAETERVLGYHAQGIQSRVAALVRHEFPQLWPRFDAEKDLEGEFMVPGAELDAPPQRWARWRDGRLAWSERP